MLNRLMSQRGMVLFIVLAIFFIVILIGNFTMGLISSQSRLTHHNVGRIQAYYAAQGALHYAFEKLRQNNDSNWQIPSIGNAYTRTLCRSGCNINDPSLPLTISTVRIRIADQGASGCNPPAGSTTCLSATAEYSSSF